MEVEEESEEIRNERQQRILNVRKVKSRDAARNRRSKENMQYLELAKLLPFPPSVTSQLDKASIIRLTIAFLKYQDLSKKAFRNRTDPNIPKIDTIIGKGRFAHLFGKDLGFHLLQALDGFLFCIGQDGKFIYISETVTTHLGLAQLDLIGTSAYSIIHPDDQKTFSELLNRNVPNSYHSLPFDAYDDFNAMTSSEMQYNICSTKESISTFTRMKCALIKRAGCYVKSSGYKVIHIAGKLLPYKDIDRNGFRPHVLVATGQPLPPPTICELKLDTKVFVSRVSMDLKIVFCEGRIHKYMNYKARDIVGLSAYEFYYSNDMEVVLKGHNDCLQSGKCITSAYRWMDKNGGWVWMQTVGTVIKRHGPYGEESQILCVNYISSDIEGEHEVSHKIQHYFNQLEINDNPLPDGDSYDDYGIDNRHINSITSTDITSLYAPPKSTDHVMDKDAFMKAVLYDNNVSGAQIPPSIENSYVYSGDAFDPLDDLGVPYSERIPSLQETLDQEEACRVIVSEMMADSSTMNFNGGNYNCGSESVFSNVPSVQGHSQVTTNGTPSDVNHSLHNISSSGFKTDYHGSKVIVPCDQQYLRSIPSNIHDSKRFISNPSNPPYYNKDYFNLTNGTPSNGNTLVKSELPSPPQRPPLDWKTNIASNNNSIVYLQHPTLVNNIVENTSIGSGCYSRSTSSYNSGDMEMISLLKQLEHARNGYFNDINVDAANYACPVPPVSHRDHP